MRRVVESLSPIRGDHLTIGLDRDPLGDEIGADHRLEVGRVVVVGMAAIHQRRRCEIGFAAELHDPFRDLVGMGRFLVSVDQELVRDRRRGHTLGGEVVALVAKRADDLGGERAVEQRDDVLAPRSVARRDGALLEAAFGGVERGFV